MFQIEFGAGHFQEITCRSSFKKIYLGEKSESSAISYLNITLFIPGKTGS